MVLATQQCHSTTTQQIVKRAALPESLQINEVGGEGREWTKVLIQATTDGAYPQNHHSIQDHNPDSLMDTSMGHQYTGASLLSEHDMALQLEGFEPPYITHTTLDIDPPGGSSSDGTFQYFSLPVEDQEQAPYTNISGNVFGALGAQLPQRATGNLLFFTAACAGVEQDDETQIMDRSEGNDCHLRQQLNEVMGEVGQLEFWQFLRDLEYETTVKDASEYDELLGVSVYLK